MLSRGLLSVLPSGWFSFDAGTSSSSSSTGGGPVAMIVDSRENKRRRESCSTPPLTSSPGGASSMMMMTATGAFRAVHGRRGVNGVVEQDQGQAQGQALCKVEETNPRPTKRIRKDVEDESSATKSRDRAVVGDSTLTTSTSLTSKRSTVRPIPVRTCTSPVTTISTYTHSKAFACTEPELKCQDDEPASINSLPVDAVASILSFLGTTKDRASLQNTSRLFRKLSNEDAMLRNIDVGGDPETGKGGIIQEHDTPATACTALTKFANAGNLQAKYMFGVIKCYCYQDLNNGVRMLETSARDGYVRAKFTIGIILRDSMPDKSASYMKEAADEGYFPALQEILPAREMKERMGSYTADEIRQYLDPVGLNRLLIRDYVNSAELRGMNTSHCWNPLCGKWAFKAGNNNPLPTRRSARNRRGNTSVTDDAVMDPPPFNQGYGHAPQQHQHQAPPPHVGTGGQSSAFARPGNNTYSGNAAVSSFQRLHAHRHNSCMAVEVPCAHIHPSQSNQAMAYKSGGKTIDSVSRMKMCSRCCRAKYCSKLCQVYDWRSNHHKMECQFL